MIFGLEKDSDIQKPGFTFSLTTSFFLGLVLLLLGALVGLAVGGFLVERFTNLELGQIFSGNPGADPAGLHAIRIFQGIVTVCMFGLAGFFWARIESQGRPFAMLGLREKPNWTLMGLGALCLLCALPVIEWMMFDADNFDLPESLDFLESYIVNTEKETFKKIKMFFKDTSVAGLVSNAIVIALLPAVAEEVFFRGMMLKNFRRKMNVHVAVWLTAIIFSFIHFQFLGFFSRMVLGAMLGYFVVFSGNLWASIAAHFANNFFNVLLAWLTMKGVFGDIELDAKYSIPFYVTLPGIILTGLFCYLFIRISKQAATLQTKPPDPHD